MASLPRTCGQVRSVVRLHAELAFLLAVVPGSESRTASIRTTNSRGCGPPPAAPRAGIGDISSWPRRRPALEGGNPDAAENGGEPEGVSDTLVPRPGQTR